MAAFRWNYLPVFVVTALLISGCVAGRRGRRHHQDHDDDDDDDEGGWAWGAAAGVGVIIAITVGVCGLFSLAAWIFCSLYSRCRKDRVGASTIIKVGAGSSAPPFWSGHLIFKPELAAGFGVVSDGFLRMGPAQLLRNRAGTTQTDGARWAVGMTTGKHVFEITWPWGHRGYSATVGVGFEDAPIKVKGRVPLVGSNPKTWGLDIVKRKALHSNKPIVTCPTDGSYVPDRFLMYVDMDDGMLGFGNEVTYWGEIISDLPRQGTQPLYVMVGASQWQSEVSVTYKGSAPDGTEGHAGEKPPHHLPPLPSMIAQTPPTYQELEGNKPIMVMPSGPSEEVMYDPPPPYSRPPSGCSIKKV